MLNSTCCYPQSGESHGKTRQNCRASGRGLGTRFLPATKAMPKEMLTVVDRPLIQYAVDEAREAGIEHFVFVTGRNKGVIEDHFDRQFELETRSKPAARPTALEDLQRICPQPAAPALPASRSRSASATPFGARAISSATSPSPSSCPTCCSRASRGVLEADGGSL